MGRDRSPLGHDLIEENLRLGHEILLVSTVKSTGFDNGLASCNWGKGQWGKIGQKQFACKKSFKVASGFKGEKYKPGATFVPALKKIGKTASCGVGLKVFRLNGKNSVFLGRHK
jgi:hypothetical protein